MKKLVLLAALIAAFTGMSFGQEAGIESPKSQKQAETKPLSFYKVEYVLRELQDGKVINSRSYIMTIADRERGEVKVGARVPVPTSETTGQYMDVGTNIQCKVVGATDFTLLETSIEISSFALPEQSPGRTQPIVRQMHTSMAAVVPNGKQTIIGVMDDVNSTKRYEIAVTATKLK